MIWNFIIDAELNDQETSSNLIFFRKTLELLQVKILYQGTTLRAMSTKVS